MYEKQQNKLKKLQKKLNKRIEELKTSLTTRRSQDWSEAAVESENDEVLEGVYTETAQDLLQVEHALQRISKGVYEECEECGEKINKKRLKIMPFTTLCIKCAQQLEFKHTQSS